MWANMCVYRFTKWTSQIVVLKGNIAINYKNPLKIFLFGIYKATYILNKYFTISRFYIAT